MSEVKYKSDKIKEKRTAVTPQLSGSEHAAAKGRPEAGFNCSQY